MSKQNYELIREKARSYFSSAKASHGWDHTKRVHRICMYIGDKEGADPAILGIAAYLHDIARFEQDKNKGGFCHAEKGADMARKILEDYSFKKEYIDSIAHCIETHRYRNDKIPETIEAKVLFDADKIDSIGAVGIGRVFMFAAEIGANLHDPNVDVENTAQYTEDDTAYREYLAKLQYINDRMMTSEGRKIAEERHRFMAEFFDRFNQEIKGKF